MACPHLCSPHIPLERQLQPPCCPRLSTFPYLLRLTKPHCLTQLRPRCPLGHTDVEADPANSATARIPNTRPEAQRFLLKSTRSNRLSSRGTEVNADGGHLCPSPRIAMAARGVSSCPEGGHLGDAADFRETAPWELLELSSQ